MAQPRLVAGGGVFVDNAFARGLIDDGNGVLQGGFGRGLVGGLADLFDGGAHARAVGAVAFKGFGIGAQALLGGFEFWQSCAPLAENRAKNSSSISQYQRESGSV